MGPPESLSDEHVSLLHRLFAESYAFFEKEAKSPIGLIPDSTAEGSPCSIAAVGLAMTAHVAATHRGVTSRATAIREVLESLRFFSAAPQSRARDATGYRGFFYHFLDMENGARTWSSELSSMDTALLVTGFLSAAQYFDGDTPNEKEIRERADALYRAVDWTWMLAPDGAMCHGWKPGSGFLPYGYKGYSEALLLYVLALGSPTHPIPAESYDVWTSTYEWREIYGHAYLHSGPLFTHQLSHCWIDFRGIQDAYMREHALDYFENSRRATYIQRAYAIDNPRDWIGYGECCWGLTASDGPGPARRSVNGKRRTFYFYEERGVPDGLDDGTIAPWAAVASLPFAPEIVVPAIEHFNALDVDRSRAYGFEATFNLSFASAKTGDRPWVSPYNYGLNQGPIVAMVENYLTGVIWELMRGCPYIVRGLERAGFRGGWLG
jgi:hypothetical protein